MKTLKLLNYAQDRWYGAEGGLAAVESAVTGEVVAETGSGGLDFAAMLDHARKVGGPALRAPDLPRARLDAEGARQRDHGAQGGIVRAQLRDRRDPHRRLDRHRRRRRHALLLLVQGPARAAQPADPDRRRRWSRCRRAAPSSASTSTPRCRASRSTSTPSTSRSGGCSRSSGPTLLAGVPAIVKPASVDRLSRRGGVPDHDRGRTCCRPARCS